MAVDVQTRTNDEWLAAIRDGHDAHALEDLRHYIRGALAKTLAKKGPVDDADLEDFTQDAVIRIMEKLDTFRGDSRFTTWATAVAIRVAFSALRKRRWDQAPVEELERLPSDTLDPGNMAERTDLLDALRYAIDNKLTERQRKVIVGHMAGKPGEDLARELDTNPNALYKLYYDTRKKLRAALEDAGFSAEDVRNELEGASNT